MKFMLSWGGCAPPDPPKMGLLPRMDYGWTQDEFGTKTGRKLSKNHRKSSQDGPNIIRKVCHSSGGTSSAGRKIPNKLSKMVKKSPLPPADVQLKCPRGTDPPNVMAKSSLKIALWGNS